MSGVCYGEASAEALLRNLRIETVILDADGNIRFYAHSNPSLLRILAGDIGRPFSDLAPPAIDPLLGHDVRSVLLTRHTIAREICSGDGSSRIRHVKPYQNDKNDSDGVIITITDVTSDRRTVEERSGQQRCTDIGHRAEDFARFSHDIRQQLQAIVLLNRLVARKMDSPDVGGFVSHIDEAIATMSRTIDDFAAATRDEVGPHSDSCPAAEVAPETFAQYSAPSDSLQVTNPGKSPGSRASGLPRTEGLVYIVDDDPEVANALGALFNDAGMNNQSFRSSEAFLEAWQPDNTACLVIDACLPGKGGIELLFQLQQSPSPPPAIVLTGSGDVSMAVDAMKAGAIDFFEKPISADAILARVTDACAQSRQKGDLRAEVRQVTSRTAALTARQRQIMMMVVEGSPSKNIAADLNISQRTVEAHRAEIMRKMGARSLPALARMAMMSTRGTIGQDIAP